MGRHPDSVVQNLFKMVKPGGKVIATAPFVLNIQPSANDYFRYTPQAMRAIFEDAGFSTVEVVGAGNAFTTMAEDWHLNRPFVSDADLKDRHSQLPSATLGFFTKPANSDSSSSGSANLERWEEGPNNAAQQ